MDIYIYTNKWNSSPRLVEAITMFHVMKIIRQSMLPISPGLISLYNDNNNCIKDYNIDYRKAL